LSLCEPFAPESSAQSAFLKIFREIRPFERGAKRDDILSVADFADDKENDK